MSVHFLELLERGNWQCLLKACFACHRVRYADEKIVDSWLGRNFNGLTIDGAIVDGDGNQMGKEHHQANRKWGQHLQAQQPFSYQDLHLPAAHTDILLSHNRLLKPLKPSASTKAVTFEHHQTQRACMKHSGSGAVRFSNCYMYLGLHAGTRKLMDGHPQPKYSSAGHAMAVLQSRGAYTYRNVGSAGASHEVSYRESMASLVVLTL